MNDLQEYALRHPWNGDGPVGPEHRRVRLRGDGLYVSTLLTTERCGCINHGHGIWHASVRIATAGGGRFAGVDDQEAAVRYARGLVAEVGDPDWELITWSSEPDRRVAHCRVAVTPGEGLLMPPGPVAPDDHDEDGVWVPRSFT